MVQIICENWNWNSKFMAMKKHACEQNIMWSMKTIIICGIAICWWPTLVFDSSKKIKICWFENKFHLDQTFLTHFFCNSKNMFCCNFSKLKIRKIAIQYCYLFSILLCNVNIKNSNQFEFSSVSNSCQNLAHTFQKMIWNFNEISYAILKSKIWNFKNKCS